MTDYTELIHALRYCANRDRPDCSVCEYEAASSCKDILKLDAADAIEELQAEVAELKRVNMEIFEDLPKRGKWIDESLDYNWYGKCSVCVEEFNVDSWYGSFHYMWRGIQR